MQEVPHKKYYKRCSSMKCLVQIYNVQIYSPSKTLLLPVEKLVVFQKVCYLHTLLYTCLQWRPCDRIYIESHRPQTPVNSIKKPHQGAIFIKLAYAAAKKPRQMGVFWVHVTQCIFCYMGGQQKIIFKDCIKKKSACQIFQSSFRQYPSPT